jgi:hypothetical protein
MTNLEKLNALLKDRNLDIPDHRRNVGPSGDNIAWLRKHIRQRNEIGPELERLLDMKQKTLVKGEYEEHASA